MRQPPPFTPLTTRDQLGTVVSLPAPPRRIVSLVPSQTELLFDLGLDAEVVGVTKFCVYPREKVRGKTVVGGTKDFRLEVIERLQPDLILGNKEENTREGIEQLRQQYPVWVSDIATLADALAMISTVGSLVNRPLEAGQLTHDIRNAFQVLAVHTASACIRPRVAYFIWRKPYMVAGAGTFIDDMLRRAGFRNVFNSITRYPEITPEQLKAAAPRRVLLSSEPYPFSEKHVTEFRTLCPAAEIQVVDGELFSWYGSRLLHSAAYFQTL